MALEFPFFKIFTRNPILTIGIVFLLICLLIVIGIYRSVKSERRVLLFSEIDKIADFLDVLSMSAHSLFTEGSKRFIRWKSAYNLKEGKKNITLWLAKRGIAYTHKPADTPEGKAVKIGSLWEAIKGILGDDTANNIVQDIKEKLMISEVFVTVELERGELEELPVLTEDIIVEDTDRHMAQIFGEGIREGLSKKDMIRDVALIGCGVAITFVLQQLGIL